MHYLASKNVLLLAGLLGFPSVTAKANIAPPVFVYDNTIPQNETDLLASDLAYLTTHDAPAAAPQMLKIMGIPQATAATLTPWLSVRVHTIVAQTFDLDLETEVLQQTYAYPNAEIFPDVLNPVPQLQDTGSASTVMLNIGGAIYLMGKQQKALIGVKVPGQAKDVQVTSPRAGIIQIGEGMFEIYAEDPASHLDGKYGAIGRLGTLFHEAHHSDGNGKSVAFLHATCPTGHVYANQPACDDNLNGPYLVGALVTQAYTESCVDCTTADQEALRLDYLDSFSRVLVAAPSSDTQQLIGELQGVLAGCKEMEKLGVSSSATDCLVYGTRLKGLLDPKNFVPATVWDSSPEGVFTAN